MFCVRNGRHKRSWRCVPLVEIYVGLLAHQVRVPTTDTLDLRQSVHNLAFTVNIGVEKTEDVLWSDIQSYIHERRRWRGAPGTADELREGPETSCQYAWFCRTRSISSSSVCGIGHPSLLRR